MFGVMFSEIHVFRKVDFNYLWWYIFVMLGEVYLSFYNDHQSTYITYKNV